MANSATDWYCDVCERKVSKEGLKAVPGASCFVVNLCSTCREKSGWTAEKLTAHWARFRAALPHAAAGEELEKPTMRLCCKATTLRFQAALEKFLARLDRGPRKDDCDSDYSFGFAAGERSAYEELGNEFRALLRQLQIPVPAKKEH